MNITSHVKILFCTLLLTQFYVSFSMDELKCKMEDCMERPTLCSDQDYKELIQGIQKIAKTSSSQFLQNYIQEQKEENQKKYEQMSKEMPNTNAFAQDYLWKQHATYLTLIEQKLYTDKLNDIEPFLKKDPQALNKLRMSQEVLGKTIQELNKKDDAYPFNSSFLWNGFADRVRFLLFVQKLIKAENKLKQ